MAYIGDITTEEQRGSGMGLMGASMGLGMVMGPALGGILSGISYAFPFFFAAGLAIANVLTVFILLKESLTAEVRMRQQEEAANKGKGCFGSILGELRTPLIQLFIMLPKKNLLRPASQGIDILFHETI